MNKNKMLRKILVAELNNKDTYFLKSDIVKKVIELKNKEIK